MPRALDPDPPERFDEDQWPRRCASVVEDVPGVLRLRAAIDRGEAICDVFVDELTDSVELEVLVCDAPDATGEGRGEVEIYLQTALNGRRIVDLSDGTVLVPGRR